MNDLTAPPAAVIQAQSALMAIGQSYLRHVLTVGATLLATHGLMTQSDTQTFVGSLLVLVPFVWCTVYHSTQAQRVAAAGQAIAERAIDQLTRKAGLAAALPPSPSAPAAPPVSVKASLVVLLLLPALSGCGTPFGIAAANMISSPVNEALAGAVVAAGVQGGLMSLEAQGNVPPSAVQAINTAVTAGAVNITSGGLDWIASVLRQQQGTPKAASPSAITAAIAPPGAPAALTSVAATVAKSVAGLNQSGVPANAANEAVAAALNAAAAVKAPAPSASQRELRHIAWQLAHHELTPAQYRDAILLGMRKNSTQTTQLAAQTIRGFRTAPPRLRTLYTANDEPAYPVVVTHQGN